jgi:S-adenosyl methyltransferase
MTPNQAGQERVDASVASIARIYDYWLGRKVEVVQTSLPG